MSCKGQQTSGQCSFLRSYSVQLSWGCFVLKQGRAGLSLQTGKPHWRVVSLVLFIVGSLIGVGLLEPLPQDLAYHRFADTRTLFGVPNFFDVVSNIPFLLVGILGIHFATKNCSGINRIAWWVFFFAITGVSAGSAYYHWAPDNATLVWDRLPMTTGFMALFVILIGEYFGAVWVRRLLAPAVLVGASSVAYWHLSDDLRFYAWVQFMPLGVIALLLLLFPTRFAHRAILLLALGLYTLAKILEYYDAVVLDAAAGLVSGHTLKHLSAAAGCYAILAMLQAMVANRRDRDERAF